MELVVYVWFGRAIKVSKDIIVEIAGVLYNESYKFEFSLEVFLGI